MPKRHQPYNGCTFSRESLHDALDSHQREGLIKGWRLKPLDPWVETGAPPGSREWQWLVTMSDGQKEPIATVWELRALLIGLASARHAHGVKAGIL